METEITSVSIKEYAIKYRLEWLINVIPDEKEKAILKEILVTHNVIIEEIDGDKRECSYCGELKHISEFFVNSYGGVHGNITKPGFVCNVCHDKNEIHSKLLKYIKWELPQGNESLYKKLERITDEIYKNECYRCQTSENHNYIDENITCPNCKYQIYWDLLFYFNKYNINERNEKIAESVINEDIINVFMFLKEIRRKLYKFKKENYETSKH